jgi:S1-C subfamily serine protease
LSLTTEPDELRRPDVPTDAGRAGEAGRPPARARQRAGAGLRRATPFLAGIAATVLAIAAFGILNPARPPLTTRDVDLAIASALASQTLPPPRSQLVYDAVRPALVVIRADRPATDAEPEEAHGLGSGVVVNDAGLVLTALHVVSDASAISVTFADGSTSSARVVSRQPESDIAVLEPDEPPVGLPPATLGNPAAMRIGSEAYVVGNPFGLAGSLSTGVVSGLDRSYEQPGTDITIGGLIQVDAAINPGNSGGPLLDRDGRVVGIVTALVNPTDQDVFIGIGLVVPIDVAGGAAGLPPY